jgi:hypothetical protein
MTRRLLLAAFGTALACSLPAVAQVFTQRIDVTLSSDEPFVGQFLPARGARRVSAVVSSEVRATAYLDVTLDPLNSDAVVEGASSVELQPRQPQLLAIPAAFIDIQAVRLRVVNRDRTFGTVRATISVGR